ncbi:hypothetical protein LZ023_37960 (plasmid) [Pseudomonas silvicola]|nr:hypothetical protein LZ023_37960 [Pseudomonas silvicola]
MSFKEKRVRESGRAPQRALRISVLAMMVASGIAQAADSTKTEQTLTVDASASSDMQEQAAKDYSVPVLVPALPKWH